MGFCKRIKVTPDFSGRMIELAKKDAKDTIIPGKFFKGALELERKKILIGEEWDDDEFYFIVNERKKSIPQVKYEKFSFCAGLLSIKG